MAGLVLLIFTLFISCSSAPPANYIILCAGDSITEIGYPPFLQRILKDEGIRAKVVNQGKSGHNSGEYLAYLEKNKNTLAQYFPDYICLQLGTNDVRTDHDQVSNEEFYAHMKEIIRIFRTFRTRARNTPRILVATIPPIPSSTSFPFAPISADRVDQEINPLIHQIAAEEKCTLVNNFSVFLNSPGLLPEVHPSDLGYETIARNWYAALKKVGMKPPTGTSAGWD
jgi:lysophospholipase L1-like esterase